MKVLDASAVLEWLRGTELGKQVAVQTADPDEVLVAPHLIDVEVASGLRKLVRMGAILPDQGRQALDVLLRLDIRRVEHTDLLPRVWELRENVTIYDAIYLVLAEALEAPLVTTDGEFERTPGHRASILTIR